MVALQTRLLSVDDYHHMIEVGIFKPDERIELVLGQLIPMAAKGSPHSAAVTRARDWLGDCLPRQQVQIRGQEPVTLQDHSEPEPDIALVRPEPGYYEAAHPRAADILLIIEVSDSTLAYDREVKLLAYAKSGIEDYWALNLKRRRLHVYRNPGDEGYGRELTLGEQEAIVPLAFPDCQIRAADFLGQA